MTATTGSFRPIQSNQFSLGWRPTPGPLVCQGSAPRPPTSTGVAAGLPAAGAVRLCAGQWAGGCPRGLRRRAAAGRGGGRGRPGGRGGQARAVSRWRLADSNALITRLLMGLQREAGCNSQPQFQPSPAAAPCGAIFWGSNRKIVLHQAARDSAFEGFVGNFGVAYIFF